MIGCNELSVEWERQMGFIDLNDTFTLIFFGGWCVLVLAIIILLFIEKIYYNDGLHPSG